MLDSDLDGHACTSSAEVCTCEVYGKWKNVNNSALLCHKPSISKDTWNTQKLSQISTTGLSLNAVKLHENLIVYSIKL